MTQLSVLPSPSLELARALPDSIGDMTALELFTAQIESNALEAQTDALHRMLVVAASLDKPAAHRQFLPYVCQLGDDWTDELLLLLGQQIVPIVRWIGTDACADILPLLERLASTEETVVRQQAVANFHALAQFHPTMDAALWTPICHRLAHADWFTPKVSACGVIAATLKLKNTAELFQWYAELCNDETPMVRRAAAESIGQVLEQECPESIHQALVQLCRDEQDSVRLLAVGALQKVQPSSSHNWLVLVKEGSTDASWRVRNNLAKHFFPIAQNVGDPDTIMACYVALLSDVEPEVRGAAVQHLAKIVGWAGPAQFTTHVQPLLPALADDVAMDVRSKCAGAIMDLAPVLDDSLVLELGPLLEAFLQDEYPQVQLQVLRNLDQMAHLLPALAPVVQCLLHMANAVHWRVRQAVGNLLPHLCQARGLEFFQSVLLPSWMTLLLDPVASVRSSIVQGVPLLAQVAGDEWMSQVLIPAHQECMKHGYLVRMTILQAHIACGPLAIPWIIAGLQDPVPNVRRVAAHGLGVLQEGRDALSDLLASETDPDVQDALQHALDQ